MARRYGLTWLAHQMGARALRKGWQDPDMLAEELFTIMTRLRDKEPESINIPTSDGVKNYITNDLGDIDIIYGDTTEEHYQYPPNPTDPTFGGSSKTIWKRATLPCQVGTVVSDNTYNVTLYPYGDMVPLKANDTEDDAEVYADITGSPHIIETTAQQLQLRSGEEIPEESWCLAAYIVQFKVSETTRDGAVISQNLEELQSGCYIQLPVWM